MSQYEADPDLVQRRLATLVQLLEEAQSLQTSAPLTHVEMHDWAHQCRNLLGTATGAPRRKSKRTEDDPLLR